MQIRRSPTLLGTSLIHPSEPTRSQPTRPLITTPFNPPHTFPSSSGKGNITPPLFLRPRQRRCCRNLPFHWHPVPLAHLTSGQDCGRRGG